MKDASLHLEAYLPAAGQNAVTGYLDLGVDAAGVSTGGQGMVSFSDNWRQGKLRIGVPALPNNSNNAVSITITLADSADGAATFQQGGSGTAVALPLIQAVIPGVATNGSAATTIDLPLPPGLRGPIQLQMAVPASAGNNTAALITADWVNE